MKEGWNHVLLGNVCRTTSGGTPSRRNPNFYEGNIPWVKSGELNSNYITETEEHISEEAIKNSSAKVFPKGTLLMAMYGATIGKVAILGIEAATNQAVCGIYESEAIETRYLYWFLSSSKSNLVKQGIGGAQPNIGQGIIKNLKIPLPPLPEQRAIVSRIEELFSAVDSGVDSLRQAQAQLKVYRQAVLKKAFEGELTKEWRAKQKDQPTAEELLKQIQEEREAHYQQQLAEWKVAVKQWEKEGKNGKKPSKPITLKEFARLDEFEEGFSNSFVFGGYRLGYSIGTIEAGKSFRCLERPPELNQVGVAKVSAVTWGTYLQEESKTCTDSKKFVTQYFIAENDFLFSRANTIDKVGACVIAKNVTNTVMLSDKILRIKFCCGYQLFYLYYFRSKFGRQELENRSTGNQDSMRNIGQDRIRQIITPLFSVEEQHQIVQEIEKRLSVCDSLEAAITESLRKAEALRQSILKQAFAGELLTENELAACRKEKDWEPAKVLVERIRKENQSNKKK